MDVCSAARDFICSVCQETKDFVCPFRSNNEYCDKCVSYSCIITLILNRGGFVDEYDN